MLTAIAAARPVDSQHRRERELEDRRLLMLYYREGDLAAREALVTRFMPLARALAGRYRSSGEPHDDLVQVACLGLVKAVDRYDPDRGSGFKQYAVPTILGELRRHFRDRGWSVHVARATQELALKVGDALGMLPSKLGRSPTPRDVAEFLSVPVEDVLEAMEAASAYEAGSLDAPRPGDEGEGDWTYLDSVAEEEHGYELVELRETLRGTLKALPGRERLILKLRFEQDLTQADIARRVGVSQMHVSRLLRRSLDRLEATGAAAA